MVSLSPSPGCGLVRYRSRPLLHDPTDPGTPFGTLSFTMTSAGTDGVNTARHNDHYEVTAQ
jgi:hypothetical protein